MNITLVEPFFTGSHKKWAQSLKKYSQHHIEILSLKGHHWKWRMYGGAVVLAERFLKLKIKPDLILATDMLDLSTFLALTRKVTHDIPSAIYFHENQITYPWSPTDADVGLQRHNQYGFINYTSALVADQVFFNSHFHKKSFLEALPGFLKQFPDYRGLQNVDKIAQKSQVLPLGMDLSTFLMWKTVDNFEAPIILWNHRWEYDKNPALFFQSLFQLQEEKIDFRLVVLGESYPRCPAIFEVAKKRLAKHILHFGYVKSFEEYVQWLWRADILPVTSQQDFFGGSVVEAMYCNCYPILPKRLAYIEHIPKDLHQGYFFETEKDFHIMLKRTVENVENIRKNLTQSFVKHYDWKLCIPKYDKAFNKLKEF